MDKWFKSKWFVSIISLAFAILLYVFVNMESPTKQNDPNSTPGGSDEIEQLEDIPVNIKMNKDEYVVTGVPKTVAVSLEGSANVLRPTAIQKKLDLYVDLTDLTPGEHNVDIEYADLPKGLKAYIEPKTVDVTIEERSSDSYKVNVDYINKEKMENGFDLGEYEVDPATVEITSSKSGLQKIALVKVFIDVKDIDESIDKREVAVNVYDSQGNKLDVQIEPENVLVSVNVHNPSKKVSVKVPTKGKLKKGYALESITSDVDDIELYANREALKVIDEITTEEVDLSKVKNSGKIDVPLNLPKNTKTDKEKVPVTIELKQTKTIKDVEIKPNNLKQDLQMKYTNIKDGSPKTDLTIQGNERDINKLDSDDYEVEIDMEDLEKGIHRIPISIKKQPKDIKTNVSDPYITVEIF